jgi:hypothetical protein
MVNPGSGRNRGTNRAISTVVDVSVCLLLISAAVGTFSLPIAGPSAPPERPDAAATVEALATGTTAVTYDLDTGAITTEGDNGATPGPEAERVAHGTHAELLAEAAVENATLRGWTLSNASDGFERRVGAAVRNATDSTGARTRVRAVWTPYPGAPTGGIATAGPAPPPGASVAAATMTVPNRFPRVRQRAIRAARQDGYAGIARVVASATVTGWFPPSQARLALRGDHPVEALIDRRYRRTAAALDTSVDGPLRATKPGQANTRIEAGLARVYERDLRRRFDSPAAAARAVRISEVQVVVRTW